MNYWFLFYQLNVWDAGDGAVKKYGHVYPACKDGAHALLPTFSFTDKNSWLELPAIINRAILPQDCITPIGKVYLAQSQSIYRHLFVLIIKLSVNV